MKTIDKVKIIIKYPFFMVSKLFYKKPDIMSSSHTVDYIKKHEVSVCRFGDGEIDLMNNVGIKFQNASKALKDRLFEVAKTNDNRVLICIPDIFKSKNDLRKIMKLDIADWWHLHSVIFEGFYSKLFTHKNGDSLFTRFYYCYEKGFADDKYISDLRSIWENRTVIFVEGNKSKNGIGNDLYDNVKERKRIICPSENAFDKYDEILKTVSSLAKKDDLVLCSLGPTATILCYDLATKYNIRSIDVGHVDLEYEWYLRKASEKILIKGKDASETEYDYVETDSKVDNIIAVIK